MVKPVTHQIYDKIFELLEKNQKGLQWKELLMKIQESNKEFHPKTVNGCIWKLLEKFPQKVYKPSKGLFCLVQYKKK